MIGSVLEGIRDGDDGGNGWTIFDGRSAELLVLAVAVPVFAWLAHVRPGMALPGSTTGVNPGTEGPPLRPWIAAGLGLFAGFLYATYYRDAIVSRVPDLHFWMALSLAGGGFGLSVLEGLPATPSIVAFLLAAGGTVIAIYLLRLVSPLHEGLAPPERGVEPPSAVDLE
ncbi:hypothetical protein SAMN05444422_101773 [Halobiforma haloterrestris]|uniref:Uncharacterized protein n=1 Tax=Natronobacterium haloterrestre TaxID=148448 RepID=A0A1I1DL40_NATHA|nr:hypothetical protein [Halobiforma haloterrestris]SFB75699.1 hypothetical protein SAMN05444422_101773 [Halobiforma haloterrestris]